MNGKFTNSTENLRMQLSNQYTKAGWYMPNFALLNDGKYGYAYTHGKVGTNFPTNPKDKGLYVYMTRDGGRTWEAILKGRHIFQATDYGRQVLSRLTEKFTSASELEYSGDFAKTFTDVTFTDTPIMVDGILTEPGSHTPYFTIFGHQNAFARPVNGKKVTDSWHIITVDASDLVAGESKCEESDYRTWTFTTPDGNETPLGMKRTFKHQKENARCQNDDTILNKETAMKIEPVTQCKASDYTCGYLYKLNPNNFKCEFDQSTYQKDLEKIIYTGSTKKPCATPSKNPQTNVN